MKNSNFLKFVFYFIAGMLIFAAYIYVKDYTDIIKDGRDGKKSSDAAEKEQDLSLDKKRSWNYEDTEDKMDGVKIHRAWLLSTNSIDFGFPYENNTFRLMLRNSGKGNEVMLQSSDKPFMTSFGSSDRCRVKFDEAPPVNYGFNSAKESMGTIFFKNPKTFISKLKTSKKLMIGCSFYEAGEKVIEFDTKDLQWNR
jgi:hypothetical protein